MESSRLLIGSKKLRGTSAADMTEPPKFYRWRNQREASHTRLEAWAQALNHISQVGLFALGLAGFFYVVIPVYQKSVLEEAVAKLQVESKAASDAIAEKEKQLRQASLQLAAVQKEAETTANDLDKTYRQLRAYGVVHLTFFLGPQCSGMLTRPLPLLRLGDPLPDPLDSARRYLEVNPQKCMEKEFLDWKFREQLRPTDLQVVKDAVRRIGVESERDRAQTLAQLNSLAERAKADPSILLPPYREILALPGTDKKTIDAMVFRNRLSRTADDLVSKYGESVRKRIDSLNSLKWEDPPKKSARAS